VWRLDADRLLVTSTDFFAPIVDDARTWGRIAAANAASDIYAMGASPLFALNLAAWPRDVLPLDLLGEVLAGGADAAADGGWVVAGGHTIDAPEPLYGMSVTGTVAAAAGESGLLTNAGGQPGQALVLTKPLGTGLLATALKRSGPEATEPSGDLHAAYEVGVAEMCRLNDAAAAAAIRAGATAATDVTGFGLLGHLAELAAASNASAAVVAGAVPLLPDVIGLATGGFVPGGTVRNLDHLTERLDGGDELTRNVLGDPQTSGGLLFSCDPERAPDAVRELRDSGHDAAVIGELTAGDSGAAGMIEIAGAIAGDAAADAD
jgi:selenide,water dikinase